MQKKLKPVLKLKGHRAHVRNLEFQEQINHKRGYNELVNISQSTYVFLTDNLPQSPTVFKSMPNDHTDINIYFNT